MPRFVILEHDHPHLHWDFMLEAGPVLRTWRLGAPPQGGVSLRVERSFAHRLAYLDYEGPVSGGRGTVTRWEAGTFTWVSDQEDEVVVDLSGSRVHGRFHLRFPEDGPGQGVLELTV
jgi:hypothetical protein